MKKHIFIRNINPVLMKLYFNCLLFTIFLTPASAQNIGINTDGSSPDASALLDVKGTKGILIPRLTMIERDAISSPATSLMIYQTDNTTGFYHFDGSSWIKLDAGGDGNYWSKNNTSAYYNSGDVGLGTDAPASKLDIRGNTCLNDNQLRLRGGTDGNHWLSYHGGGGFDGAKLYGNSTLALQTGNLEVVMRDGKLGVNTASPSNGILHVAGGDVYTSSGGNYFDASFGNGVGTMDYQTYNSNTSIYAEHNILTSGQFLAESDKRVKNITQLSNNAQDLKTLNNIQITDYTMKDVIAEGNKKYKKVIAQQVEEVFPLAVGRRSNFIPNVYKKTTLTNGRMPIENDLAIGDEVKLFMNNTQSNIEVIAKDANTIQFATDYSGEAFIYGKKVDDFRIVDYDAISMLNVSATQELYRLIEMQKDQIDNLLKANETLKASVDSNKADIEMLKNNLNVVKNK